MTDNIKSKPRGFAAFTPEKLRETAAKGGASARPENRSFSRNRELAAEVGRKGGQAKRSDGNG